MAVLRDVFHFLWIALREYWITWVTGTGLVGFGLWLLHFIDRRMEERGRQPMTLRENLLILAAVFWFLATFSAWHDADKNLEAVKRQRQQDTGNLVVCLGDLKAEKVRADALSSHNDSLQGTINSQQATTNACVVALTKASIQEPFRANVWTVG